MKKNKFRIHFSESEKLDTDLYSSDEIVIRTESRELILQTHCETKQIVMNSDTTVHGDLVIEGNLEVKGNLIVNGQLIALDTVVS